MRREYLATCARVMREVAMKVIMVVMLLSTTLYVACSDSPTEEPEKPNNSMGDGVELPAETTRNCGANSATIKFSIKTEAGYSLEVDNTDMITIKSGSSATQGGTYQIDLEISRNNTGAERRGNIFITVVGHSRIKAMEIIQAAGATDEVVKWVDERLQNEYYWLDEYNEKLNMFDYSLPYDKFLSTSLLSMTTNMEDGYVSGGTRYLYSYITRESTTRADDDRMEHGFGILLSARYFGGENNTAIFVVEHVYPNSPAANAGLKRGDTISLVDGNTIPAPSTDAALQQFYDARNKLLSGTGALTIEGETFDKATQRDIIYRYNLTSADYDPNPVAFSAVLEIDERINSQINPNGKKIGYLSYLGFESEFDDELIEAVEYLAAKGITDLILDLRVNGGGSVNTSTMLASMILSEDYVGKTYATLKRNPNNTFYPKEHLNTECLITKSGLGDFEDKELPNLNLPELWVITSNSTASASEMVIKGLEGLDVPVKLVGKTTNGKNCGMDVIEKTIGSYIYTYAPITFMNYNAKDDNDYADGITPGAAPISGVAGVNFDKYWNESNIQSSYQSYQCYVFPMPMANWAELNFDEEMYFSGDFALYETVLRICGRTMLQSSSAAAKMDVKPAMQAVTRAATLRKVGEVNLLPQNRAYGATLTAEEREALESKKQ